VDTVSIADECVSFLAERGVTLAPGLSAQEFRAVEDTFGFEFGPDHRGLLRLALPSGDDWVDWRQDPEDDLRWRLGSPTEGVLFDVAHNSYWDAGWGPRPEDDSDAAALAKPHIERWHKLVPIFSHRYTPAAPAGPGAPVFSVHQSDVIFYGSDLLDYFKNEFGSGGMDSFDAGRADLAAYRQWSTIALG
jgi:hypothetical protein